jgi:NAD(P)-dependent dehydrogenase (short-subunit alcohol dehydrogenase family)
VENQIMNRIKTALCGALLSVCAGVSAAELKADAPTVFITGANRGIGLEFVRQFSDRGWNIIATARKPAEAEDLNALAADNPQIIVEQLDVTDYARVEALAEQYAERPIDILLSNAAITPRYRTAFGPAGKVDFDMARQSYEVNALAPLKLGATFMPLVAAADNGKIVVLSSKAGSFEESPKMPMMYSYRASKAALNMLMYTLSFESKKQDVITVVLSPGTVNTTPGFNNPQGISAEESVSKMLKLIDGVTAENNGQFLDYADGRIIPW